MAEHDSDPWAPALVDLAYLRALGVTITPTLESLAGLERGSHALARRLREGTLVPRSRVTLADIDPASALEIHDYTGSCPTRTYELAPMVGCHVGCLYCLVTDGAHEQALVVWRNYADLVARALEERYHEPHFYYLSPKTEALQPPTLDTGVLHAILRAFVRHYEKRPSSRARLFVASKGGVAELESRRDGESVLDLFARLGPRMQYNPSVSILPEEVRAVLEPHAPPVAERLRAARLCQSRGVAARSALVQPLLLPFLTDERVEAAFAAMAQAGMVNFKPELLTVSPECLATVGQLVGRYDRAAERALYEDVLAPGNRDHRKQRERLAPDRALSSAALDRLIRVGARHGLTASVCAWVRRQLGISEEQVPLVNSNGYQCLGYQTRLLEED